MTRSVKGRLGRGAWRSACARSASSRRSGMPVRASEQRRRWKRVSSKEMATRAARQASIDTARPGTALDSCRTNGTPMRRAASAGPTEA